jgi:hypothetical protein
MYALTGKDQVWQIRIELYLLEHTSMWYNWPSFVRTDIYLLEQTFTF